MSTGMFGNSNQLGGKAEELGNYNKKLLELFAITFLCYSSILQILFHNDNIFLSLDMKLSMASFEFFELY